VRTANLAYTVQHWISGWQGIMNSKAYESDCSLIFCTLPESACRIKENFEKRNSWCPRLDSNQSPEKIQVKSITIWINWLKGTTWAQLQACTIIILYIQLFHEMSAKFQEVIQGVESKMLDQHKLIFSSRISTAEN